MASEKTIWLADLRHVQRPKGRNDFTDEEYEKARKYQESIGLRFNNSTGILRDNKVGQLSYVYPEFEPYRTDEDLFRWEFDARINNSISRMRSGYAP